MEPTEGPSLLDGRQLARVIEGQPTELAPPAEPATPAAEAPPATPPVDYAAQIAALQAELAAVRQMQSLPTAPDIASASAQGTAMFLENVRRQREAEARQQQTLQPPQMPTDDELLTNPQALRYAISASSEHAARSVYQALAPQVADAQTLRQMLQPLLLQGIGQAEQIARSHAEQAGIPGETFDRLLPLVRATIDNAPATDYGRLQLRMNPETLVAAAWMVQRQQGGAPITPAAPPTSIGSTQAPPSNGKRGPDLPGTDLAERMLGRKFSAKDREWLAANTSRAVNEAAQFSFEGGR